MRADEVAKLARKLDSGGGSMGEPPSVCEIGGVVAFFALVAALVWGAAA